MGDFLTARRNNHEPNWGGTRQNWVVLVLAVVVTVVGLTIPIAAGVRAGGVQEALPYALIGLTLGGAVGGLALRLLPTAIGTPLAIITLVLVMLVFSQLGGFWILAVPPYIMATFAGSCIGSHLRFRAWKRSRSESYTSPSLETSRVSTRTNDRNIVSSSQTFESEWRADDHKAVWNPIVHGSRREEPAFTLVAGGVSAQFWVTEVIDLIEGEVAVAESRTGSPVAYLTHPGTGTRDTAAGSEVPCAEAGSLIMTTESLTAPGPIIMSRVAVDGFIIWLRQLVR